MKLESEMPRRIIVSIIGAVLVLCAAVTPAATAAPAKGHVTRAQCITAAERLEADLHTLKAARTATEKVTVRLHNHPDPRLDWHATAADDGLTDLIAALSVRLAKGAEDIDNGFYGKCGIDLKPWMRTR